MNEVRVCTICSRGEPALTKVVIVLSQGNITQKVPIPVCLGCQERKRRVEALRAVSIFMIIAVLTELLITGTVLAEKNPYAAPDSLLVVTISALLGLVAGAITYLSHGTWVKQNAKAISELPEVEPYIVSGWKLEN